MNMIKNEVVLKQQKSKICFNPSCPTPETRIFHHDHSHAFNIPCLNWIVDMKKYDFSQIEDKEDIVFNFGEIPFKDNINSCQLINSINIEIYFDLLKKQLIASFTQQLTLLFQKLVIKYNFVPAQEIIENISNLSESLDDPNSEQKVEFVVQKYLKMCQNKEISLKIPLKEQFISQFQKIREWGRKFYNERVYEEDQERIKITYEESEKIKEYVFNEDAPFNKLQQIASLCGLKMDNMQVNNRDVKIWCPFCGFQESMQIGKNIGLMLKQLKKQVSLQMLYHCYIEHSSLFAQHILLKVVNQQSRKEKKTVILTYHTFSKNIVNYKKLRIIDRESGIAFKNPPSGTYTLQIISKPNKLMSRMKHILTEDRKITQFLIYFMIVDVCYLKNIMDINDVTLQSKSCTIERAKEIGKIIHPQSEISSSSRKTKLKIKQGNGFMLKKQVCFREKQQEKKKDDKQILKLQY